jgi:hypothetical protein
MNILDKIKQNKTYMANKFFFFAFGIAVILCLLELIFFNRVKEIFIDNYIDEGTQGVVFCSIAAMIPPAIVIAIYFGFFKANRNG